MVLNLFGKIIDFHWQELTQHFKNIKLDEYKIMPNHFHGIINIVGAMHSNKNNPIQQNNLNGNASPLRSTDGGANWRSAIDSTTDIPDGTRKWKFHPSKPGGTPCGASAVVGSESTIYVIPNGEILYAVRPDGTLKWKFYLENYDEHSFCSPSLDADNVIYFGTENGEGGYVYAVYPTGILKWRILASRLWAVRSSPSIGPDGTVYVGTKAYSHRQPAEVLAISPEGTIKWRFIVQTIHLTPDDVYSSPTLGADGLIYFGAETGFIYALNPDGTLNWKQDLEMGINWSSPTLLDDGTIYIGGIKNTGGALIALQSSSPGLAHTSWPTFRQNNKNTGRYGEF